MIADCPLHQGCPFIFTNDGVKAQSDVVRLKQKLYALLAKYGGPAMAHCTFHDFRRSLVSAASPSAVITRSRSICCSATSPAA